jgi:putative transposase
MWGSRPWSSSTRLQRELYKKVKGAKNRAKVRQKIARLYALISDVRRETLNQAIIDASWGELVRQLRYKGEWYGRTLMVVDRFFPSTRRCSACHAMGPRLDVSVRRWTCASGRGDAVAGRVGAAGAVRTDGPSAGMSVEPM